MLKYGYLEVCIIESLGFRDNGEPTVLWKRGEKRATSPLFHNILLPAIRFLCLNRDPFFTSK